MIGNVIYEGEHSLYFGSRAQIIDDSIEMAWAEKHIQHNDFNYWILGKYLEVDKANSNRQRFKLEDITSRKEQINYAPLNMNHTPHIVGSYVANELLYPMENSEDGQTQPFVEALSVMWKERFPDDARVVESAHKAGTLFYSMECLPSKISCGGDTGCGGTFEYAGRQSVAYCEHLNDPQGSSDKILIEPQFVGGALIVPPHRPGWNKASVREISKMLEDSVEAAAAYEQAANAFENLSSAEVEQFIISLAHLRQMAVDL